MSFWKNDHRNLFILTIFNLGIRLFRIDSPARSFFDERAFYIEGAKSYLTGFADPNLEHPPLGKEIMALSIKFFGDNPWGWRVPSVLFGTIGILLTYLLAKKIFGSTKIALVSALLLTFDFLWFVHSRIGLLEIFLAVFCLTAVYFLWGFYQKSNWKNGLWFAFFTGLAVSTKWTGVFLLPAAGILFLIKYFSSKPKIDFGSVISMVVTIVLLATTVYWVSFQPYLKGQDLPWFWNRQVAMWQYHTQEIKSDNAGASRPWSWGLDPLQPYYTSPQTKSYVISFANPVLLWGGLLGFGYWLVRNFRNWGTNTGFLVVMVLAFWWPWLLVSRYTFFYYFLTAMPFLAIILARSLEGIEGSNWRFKNLFSVEILLTGNALAFILIYPLLTALPVASLYLSLLFGHY